MPEEVECAYCGGTTEKPRSKIKRAERNFCNNECKHAFFRENNHIFNDQEKVK